MFVGRRQDGTIYGMWTVAQTPDSDHPGLQELPDDHPDVIAFRDRPRPQPEDRVGDLDRRVNGKTDALEAKDAALDADIASVKARLDALEALP